VIPVGDVLLRSTTGELRVAAVASGEYQFEGLEPGRWWVEVGGKCYRRENWTIDLGAGESRRLDLAVQRCLAVNVLVQFPEGERGLGGRIRSGLEPLVTLVPPGDYHVVPRGAHANGGCRFERSSTVARSGTKATRLGTLYLEDELPVYVSLVSNGWVLATRHLVEPAPRLHFVLDPEQAALRSARLRVQAFDRVGRPVPSWGWVRQGDRSRSLELDPNGRAELEGLAPEHTFLGFLDIGCFEELDLAPGASIDLVLREVARGTLYVHLVGDDGAPVYGIPPPVLSVRVDRGGSAPSPVAMSFDLEDLREGRFSVELPPGRFVLRVERAGAASRPVTLEIESGELRELEIALHRTRNLILRPPRRGWETSRCAITDEQGHEMAFAAFQGPYPHRLPVPPGPCRVRILDPSDRVRWERAVVLADEPVVLQVP